MTTGSAFAYQYVNGHRVIAGPDTVQIGGEVYPVAANPTTVEEKQRKAAWLQAQIDDLSAVLAAMPAGECDK